MASPEATDWAKKIIPIDRIKVDQAMQVRGSVNPEVVKSYEVIVKEQGPMGVLALFAVSEGDPAETVLLLADGFHRLDAYRACGMTEIPCGVKVGTRSEAIKYSLRENGHHGMPMTSEQKRHAASVAVLDPTIGMMTDKEISRMVGCSPSLISEVRRGETPAQKTAKKERKTQAQTKSNVGKRETESPAPREATVRQRKPAEVPAPTKPQVLREIQEWLDSEVIEEADLVRLMGTKNAGYVLAPRPGMPTTLKVVGKSGHAQVEVQVLVKQINEEGVVLKFETGKLLEQGEK